MEPKEMTNEELLSEYACLDMAEGGEILRRLNESDALRKENAIIRGDNADLLSKQDAFVFTHNNMAADIDALRKENEELKEKIYFFARTFRYYAGEAFRFYEKHPLARETDETRAANTTKEGEASHDH